MPTLTINGVSYDVVKQAKELQAAIDAQNAAQAATVAALEEAKQKLATQATRPTGFSCKIGAKGDGTITGAVSIYSCGSKFPVNVHSDQWAEIKANMEAIDKLFSDNPTLPTMKQVLAAYASKRATKA